MSHGVLAASNFRAGATALDSDDYILNDNGVLSYDADANGANAAVVIATLANSAAIDESDILVV